MYGRARRIALARTIIIVVGIIIVLYMIISTLLRSEAFYGENEKFEYLRSYFDGQGYVCKSIDQNGGSCSLKKNNFKYNFVRYDNGFFYLVNGSSYSLTINFLETEKNQIEFKTKENALKGYQKKTYYCTTNGLLTDELKECITKNGEKLDLDTYLGAVESGLMDINNIINASGYNKESLLKNYVWEK